MFVKDRIKETEWLAWLITFFRTREFTMEWDGKVWEKGKTNVGAP